MMTIRNFPWLILACLLFACAPAPVVAWEHGNPGLGAAPTISSVNPNPVPTVGETGITITGTNLTGATALRIAGTSATIVANSSTNISATFPAKNAGSYHVRVTTPNGTSAATSNDLVTYTAPAWTPSFTAAATDASGNYMAGTELRQLAVLNPYCTGVGQPIAACLGPAAIYATTGYLDDLVDTTQGGQILTLNAPVANGGLWKVDENLNNLCTSLTPSFTAVAMNMGTFCFTTMDVLMTTSFTQDSAGSTLSPPVTILSTSPITNGATAACTRPTFAFERNNTPNDNGGNGGFPWYGSFLACDSGGQVRAFSWVGHTDIVTGKQYIFAGQDNTGTFSGQLNHNQGAGQPPVLWPSFYGYTVGAVLHVTSLGAGQLANGPIFFPSFTATVSITGQTSGAPGGVGAYTLSNSTNTNVGSVGSPVGFSAPEWLSSTYLGPTGQCTPIAAGTVRPMGFAELVGLDGVSRSYMEACFTIYVRVDGVTPGAAGCTAQQVDINGNCVARWQPYWYSTNQNISANGLRALTALNEDTPQDMITGYEGSVSTSQVNDQGVWNIPSMCPSATPACSTVIGAGAGNSCADYSATTGAVSMSNPTCATNEYYTYSQLYNFAGMHSSATAGKGSGAFGVYNYFTAFRDVNNNIVRYEPFNTTIANPTTPPSPNWTFISSGSSTKVKWGEGQYFVRAQGGGYTLVVPPDLFSQATQWPPHTPQGGTRTVTPSPFLSECAYDGTNYYNCAVYLAGFITSNATTNNGFYWCAPGTACPTSPTLVAATNTTAWVAHYGPGNTVPPVPYVNSVSPATGGAAGGTAVTITGHSFTGATAVSFGANAATLVTVVSDTTITANSPAGGSTVDVTVTTPGGVSPTTPADDFAYGGGVPVINSILPSGGGLAGGTPVTISGSGFMGANAVKFNTTSVTFTYVSDSTITTTSPAGTGTENVTVTTPVATSATNANTDFDYADAQEVFAACSAAPCSADANGVYVGGTELRALIAHWIPVNGIMPGTALATTCTSASPNYSATMNACPSVMAGNGFWEDTNCIPAGRHPEILALIDPAGSFNEDTTVNGSCTSDVFPVNNSLYDMTFSIDGTGTAIPPLELAVATGVGGGNVYERNDTTGLWNLDTYTGSGSIRSLGTHVDSTTTNCGAGKSCDYLLLGDDTSGIYHGTFLSSPWGFTFAAASEPWGTGTCRLNTCTNSPADWAGQTWPATTATSDNATPSNVTIHWVGAWDSAPTGTVTITGFTAGTGGVGNTSADVTNAPIVSSNVTSLVYTAVPTVADPTGIVTCGTGGCHGGTIDGTGMRQTGCNQITECGGSLRVMAMADCPSNGVMTLFASIDMELYQRVDGNSPHWLLSGVVPLPNAAGNSKTGGQRGLTCVQYNGGYALLAASEGAGSCLWRINPDNGAYTCEAQLTGGSQAGNWTSGYGINAYNSMTVLGNPTNPTVVFGEGTSFTPPASHPYQIKPSSMNAHLDVTSGLWIRSTSIPPTYSLWPLATAPIGTSAYATLLGTMVPKQTQPPAGTLVWPVGPATCSSGKCPSMMATRATVLSPFPSDANQYLYFGGFDANAMTAHDTAWVMRVPLSTIGLQ